MLSKMPMVVGVQMRFERNWSRVVGIFVLPEACFFLDVTAARDAKSIIDYRLDLRSMGEDVVANVCQTQMKNWSFIYARKLELNRKRQWFIPAP